MARMTSKKNTADPLTAALDGLRVAVARHQRATERADEEVTSLVADVLAAGGTWVDVGDATGQTRGNAQRKFGPRIVVEKTVRVRSTKD